MYRACIAIVDATRARLYRFQRTSDADSREELTEEADLVDLARRQRPSELFSDSGSGSTRNGPALHSYDDHRDSHLHRLDADFARKIVAELVRMLGEHNPQRLIICASPRMLGELREVGSALHREGLIVDELARDLVKLTTPEIRDHLAACGLLPPPFPRPTRDVHM